MIAELIDPAVLGFILVGVMLFAIFVGFPISFTLIFLGPNSLANDCVIPFIANFEATYTLLFLLPLFPAILLIFMIDPSLLRIFDAALLPQKTL